MFREVPNSTLVTNSADFLSVRVYVYNNNQPQNIHRPEVETILKRVLKICALFRTPTRPTYYSLNNFL